MKNIVVYISSITLVPLFILTQPMMSVAGIMHSPIKTENLATTQSLSLTQDLKIDSSEVNFSRAIPTVIDGIHPTVALAREYLDYAYIFGMASPSRGFDCSGLIQYVWKEIYNKNLPHSVYAQAQMSERIPYSEAKEGDLVVYFAKDGSDDYTHAGIYAGEGMVIHASRGRGMVVEEDINIMESLRFEIYRLP